MTFKAFRAGALDTCFVLGTQGDLAAGLPRDAPFAFFSLPSLPPTPTSFVCLPLIQVPETHFPNEHVKFL